MEYWKAQRIVELAGAELRLRGVSDLTPTPDVWGLWADPEYQAPDVR